LNPLKTICEAIAAQCVCRFQYNGTLRTVEIYCHGLGASGKELVRCYELIPNESPHKWKLFDVNRMIGFAITGERFTVRAEYRPQDPAIPRVCCGIGRIPSV
jgi:hypothetical protein